MGRTKLAVLIAKEEGFGRPGKIPTIRHNPGDLRHSPHSQHPDDPEAVGTIDSDAHGWEDLERQLRLFAERDLTLEEVVYKYAPPSENNSAKYLADICAGLGVGPKTSMVDVLKIPA